MNRLFQFTLILIVAFIFRAQSSVAQIQDLSKLADGELVFNDILWDENNKVFGYFYLFENDFNKKNETKTMEYVILDKNLNKAFNSTFTIHNIKRVKGTGVIARYLNSSLIGTSRIMLSKSYYYKEAGVFGDPLASSFQMISLKDKTCSAEQVYYDGALQDLNEQHPFMRGEISTTTLHAVNNSSNEGFLVRYDKSPGFDVHLKFLDADHKLKWSYNYNPVRKKKHSLRDYSTYSVAAVGQKCLYLLLVHRVKYKAVEFTIAAVDFKTGEEKYKYVFEDRNSQYNKTIHAAEINNQLVVVGNYSEYSKRDFQLDENKGFYKLTLDETGKETGLSYTKWSDFPALQVDEDGRVEKKFRLRPTQFYFFNDGKVSILTEKYRPDNAGIIRTLPKTSDFILFNMNKEFKKLGVHTIKKELSKTSDTDYLFHQYIKDENGVAFFYGDYASSENSNDKNWILGINTIIDGKLTEEKIPISSKKKYFIQPYPAKEGYIMLREYNEKDKYNQVRLEKLNY